MVRDVTLGLALALLAVPVRAEDVKGMPITLPSGAVVQWQETLHDDANGQGLTYRFRFVLPDLAARAPDAVTDQGQDRGPIDIDTETAEIAGLDQDMPEPDPVPESDAETDPEAEAAADDMIADAGDAAGQDPLHDDMVWLCQNWALPRISETSPRPSQIVISLSSKELAFGSYDPDALQLFEAFTLPADRDACIWEPW